MRASAVVVPGCYRESRYQGSICRTIRATVTPNLKNNSLIVIGDPEQLQEALEVIERVDVPRN